MFKGCVVHTADRKTDYQINRRINNDKPVNLDDYQSKFTITGAIIIAPISR